MLPLGQLKQNLVFNTSLGGIIDVLKVAASIQLRQFQSMSKPHDEFFKSLKDAFDMLDTKNSNHPFLVSSEGLANCIVVITSDEGFAGELNSLLLHTALQLRDTSKLGNFVVLGERGAAFLEDMNESFVFLPGVSQDIDSKEIDRLKDYLIKEYLKGVFSKITIVYSKFISLSSQRVETEEILPCRYLFKESGLQKEGIYKDLIIGPDFNKVLEDLVRLWLGWTIYNIFWSNKLSEFVARLMHLERSTQELSRVNQKLTMQYFRHLHDLADKSIREISAARLVKKY